VYLHTIFRASRVVDVVDVCYGVSQAPLQMCEVSEVVRGETDGTEAEDAPPCGNVVCLLFVCLEEGEEKWAESLSKSRTSCNRQRILQKVDIDAPSARNWCLW